MEAIIIPQALAQKALEVDEITEAEFNDALDGKIIEICGFPCYVSRFLSAYSS